MHFFPSRKVCLQFENFGENGKRLKLCDNFYLIASPWGCQELNYYEKDIRAAARTGVTKVVASRSRGPSSKALLS